MGLSINCLPHRSHMDRPHLAIVHVDSIPSDVFAEFRDTVATEGLELRIGSRENGGAFAALEWLLPTAVIAYISKPYFDGFLKEMGKDHYGLLKLGFQKLRSRVFGESAPNMVLVGSKGKISNEQPYSLVFSVIAEAEPCLTFKLLIQKDASEQEYALILEAFLNFLATFHSGALDEQMIERLQSSRVVGGTLLFAFNLETKTLETLDPIPKRSPPNEA